MKTAFALVTAALVVGGMASSEPAMAAGCGGYVNVWVSGCAPWDNNPRRMPGAPGYQAPRATPPAAQPRFVQQPPATRPAIQPGINTRSGLISERGGSLISDRGGALISDRGHGLIGKIR